MICFCQCAQGSHDKYRDIDMKFFDCDSMQMQTQSAKKSLGIFHKYIRLWYGYNDWNRCTRFQRIDFFPVLWISNFHWVASFFPPSPNNSCLSLMNHIILFTLLQLSVVLSTFTSFNFFLTSDLFHSTRFFFDRFAWTIQFAYSVPIFFECVCSHNILQTECKVLFGN